MRWFGRIFANAVARRIAALLVAAVLAWVGIGRAEAQSSIGKCDYGQNCTQKQAWDAINDVAWFCGKWSIGSTPIVISPPKQNGTAWQYVSTVECQPANPNSSVSIFGVYTVWYSGCPTGQEFNDYRGVCQSTCSSRPVETVTYQQMIPNGSVGCFDGCEAMIHSTGLGDGSYTKTYIGGASSHCLALPKNCSDFGQGYGMNFGNSMCQPPFVECPANKIKDPISGICTDGCEPGKIMDANGVCKPEGDHCPPGNVKSPSGACLPGDGQCATGEAKGKDGTCKRDSNNDGTPDEEEGPEDPNKDSASGGDSCNAPPSCNGNPIMCLQLRTQWRIDCNTRKNRDISGGACNAMPICAGEDCDALEYSQLLQQWKSACALEKLANKDGGSGDHDPNVEAIKEALTGNGGTPDVGAEGNPADSWAGGGGQGTEPVEPDTSGYGWGGGSCPTPPTIQVLGASITFDATPVCKWLGLGSYFVMGLAALASLRIIGSKEA